MIYSKKSLGQNFLKDLNIIKKIVDLVKVYNRDILEIGPGKGALTDEIIRNKRLTDLAKTHFCFRLRVVADCMIIWKSL